MRVGAILKACRTRAGLSQAELADKIHINQSDVSKYESDLIEPHISTLQAWTSNTQTTEVMVAFIMGMDGLGIMQQILELSGGAISFILLLGGFM